MIIKLEQKKFDFDINIKKDMPVIYHVNEKGEQVNDFTIKPVKGHFELSGDITLDTGELRAVDVIHLMRTYKELQESISKRCHKIAE